MENIKEVKKVNIINNKCHCCNNEAIATVMNINLCDDCISLFDRYRREIRDNVKNTFANFIVWKDKYRGK